MKTKQISHIKLRKIAASSVIELNGGVLTSIRTFPANQKGDREARLMFRSLVLKCNPSIYNNVEIPAHYEQGDYDLLLVRGDITPEFLNL